ncbi:MAG: phage tail tube protein [Lachnospirales bacterium]
MENFFNTQDAPNARQANMFVTVDSKRYAIATAKNFEATANIETVDVPVLGGIIKGKKAVGMEIAFKMTIFKVTELFDDMVETFKSTGVMPVFEIQTTSEDPASTIGATTKIYKNCIIDGSILLSMFDSEGELIEQEINGFAMDYTSKEKYTNPTYMNV